MPIDRTYLLQVRITEEEKRRIKTLAASQGMTVQKAVVEAFAAWGKELKAGAKQSREAKQAGKKKSASQ
jgi:hypothetical protein